MVLRLFAALAFLVWTAATVQAEELTQTSLRIPARYGSGESLTLEGLLVRPNGPGPFPIAVMTHGSPRDPLERPKMGPSRLVPQAREFAKRGWATLVVMRRGYGGSDGPYVETSGPCNSPDYRQSGERGADDLRQAIRYMARQPFADASRIIAVGVSAGGFASVALTADPPPGLVAAISFAGGRGSQADNTVCTPDRLVDAFASFGRTSRLPTLWVYAENDLFFGPALARRFFDAFTRGGGRADFAQAPANGKDGHFLFSAAIPSWTPRVDRFLDANGLSARPIPAARPLAPPPELSERNRAGFRTYAEAPDFKAFAVSPEGGYGWKSGQGNEAEARRGALENCAKHTQKVCRIAFVNDTAIR